MTAATMVATRTVLVADDTAFVRDRFKAAIEAAGHNAMTACTGQELLAYVHTNASRLDLIVLDLRIPRGNRVAMIHAIQKLGHHPPIVVFCGTIASAGEVRQLDALGVAGYVNEYTAARNIFPSLLPHLSADSCNRRSSPRVSLVVPVTYRSGNAIAAALTSNISRGGLAIRTTNPLAVDTTVRVRFRLPPGMIEIDVEARVKWAERRAGMGVEFTRVGASEQSRIERYVESHLFSNRKA
jgi:uncharacterized protein (TIGR02266 family)